MNIKEYEEEEEEEEEIALDETHTNPESVVKVLSGVSTTHIHEGALRGRCKENACDCWAYFISEVL